MEGTRPTGWCAWVKACVACCEEDNKPRIVEVDLEYAKTHRYIHKHTPSMDSQVGRRVDSTNRLFIEVRKKK